MCRLGPSHETVFRPTAAPVKKTTVHAQACQEGSHVHRGVRLWLSALYDIHLLDKTGQVRNILVIRSASKRVR